MAQGRLDDERQLYHVLTQEREGGHGIARGQKVLDDRESFVRVGRQEFFIQFNVFFCLPDVGLREFFVFAEKVCGKLYAVHRVPEDVVLVGRNEVYPVDRMGEYKGEYGARSCFGLRYAYALRL